MTSPPSTSLWPLVTPDQLRQGWRRVAHRAESSAHLVPARHLHDEWSTGARTLAEQLGHLAQSMRHVSDQTGQWMEAGRRVLGRAPVHDADRDDALERARLSDLPTLLAELTAATAATTQAVDRLETVHLSATVRHVVHGREPLVTMLWRDLILHADDHLDELDATLDQLPCCVPGHGGSGAPAHPCPAPPHLLVVPPGDLS